MIRVLQGPHALWRYLSKNPNGETWPWEWLPLQDLLRHVELLAEKANLILEELSEGLNQLEL